MVGFTLTAACVLPLLVSETASATGTLTQIVYPDDTHAPVYALINSATKSLDMTMYELNDTTAEQDLANAAARGVAVRVILDGRQSTKNGPAYTFLNSHGVPTVWSSSTYYYTHEKSIVVDGASVYIASGNLDATYYSSDRDYAVTDTDPGDVAAVEQVFNADYTGTAITPSDGTDLVWSPTDSQTHLLDLVNSATRTLDIEELEVSSTTMIAAVENAAKRGVRVDYITEYNRSWTSTYKQLKNAGVHLSYYGSNAALYIHAKAIVADYGTSAAKAFEGSENFSDTSLNQNRELGVIVSDSGVLNRVESTIAADFSGATPF
ncbi:hypothetical protein KGA66_19620 [Actinocrinis puniceicyclus]|uniref:phospholipase D n=1 Tax=Actinocrinis puniceicyclus TaxID=977794 RepID=A0A8J7WPT5_9ACTN|nr:phospholipase D-like domain-containing protein [Actinocrinis puniceicyclus]MBS2965268.1 hypothetical protein [Actinocrinis puniceicyclus]